MTTKKTTKKKLDFDQTLAKLEGLLASMEQENVGLEQALKQFEEGIKLAHDCQARLEEAEQTIAQLTQDKD